MSMEALWRAIHLRLCLVIRVTCIQYLLVSFCMCASIFVNCYGNCQADWSTIAKNIFIHGKLHWHPIDALTHAPTWHQVVSTLTGINYLVIDAMLMKSMKWRCLADGQTYLQMTHWRWVDVEIPLFENQNSYGTLFLLDTIFSWVAVCW